MEDLPFLNEKYLTEEAVAADAACDTGKRQFPRLVYDRKKEEENLPSAEKICRIIWRILAEFADKYDKNGVRFLRKDFALADFGVEITERMLAEIRVFLRENSQEVISLKNMADLKGDILVKIYYQAGVGQCIAVSIAANGNNFAIHGEDVYVFDSSFLLGGNEYRGKTSGQILKRIGETYDDADEAALNDINRFVGYARNYLTGGVSSEHRKYVLRRILETRLALGSLGAALHDALKKEYGFQRRRVS